MLETYILKINRNLEAIEFNSLLSYICDDKKERILRFHRYEDAQRCLLGDVMVRYVICKRIGVKNSELVFGMNEYGKPLLIYPKEIHFNISHSGKYVVCAVDNNPVGVDVEEIKPIDFEIAKRFFSANEYLQLINQPEEMRLKYFYTIWTLKESYIKAEGKGLSIPLNSFSINIDDYNAKIITKSNNVKYSLCHSFLEDNYKYAVYSIGKNIDKNTDWSIELFLKELSS